MSTSAKVFMTVKAKYVGNHWLVHTRHKFADVRKTPHVLHVVIRKASLCVILRSRWYEHWRCCYISVVHDYLCSWWEPREVALTYSTNAEGGTIDYIIVTHSWKACGTLWSIYIQVVTKQYRRIHSLIFAISTTPSHSIDPQHYIYLNEYPPIIRNSSTQPWHHQQRTSNGCPSSMDLINSSKIQQRSHHQDKEKFL